MAATRISPSRHTPGKSTVREWQMVTVACACSSSNAIGLPTMSLRPTTTARLPANGIRYCRNSSMMPAGVQGRGPGRPATRLPMFMGWNPSTSFSGETASSTRRVSTCGGKGNCTRMPSISGRRFRPSTISSNSSVVMVAGGVRVRLAMPNSAQAFTLLRT
jgi:hypothetical protein